MTGKSPRNIKRPLTEKDFFKPTKKKTYKVRCWDRPSDKHESVESLLNEIKY